MTTIISNVNGGAGLGLRVGFRGLGSRVWGALTCFPFCAWRGDLVTTVG